jgi:8-oxo-dGTP diphosphatase
MLATRRERVERINLRVTVPPEGPVAALILFAGRYCVRYCAAMPAIRIAPRAIIRRGDLYLVMRYIDSLGDWFVFPGGGQAHGEDLQQALQREVEEEIGVKPFIRDLRFVRECIASRNNSTNLPRDFHQIEIFFDCTIDSDPVVGRGPDPNQTGFEWQTISTSGASDSSPN